MRDVTVVGKRKFILVKPVTLRDGMVMEGKRKMYVEPDLLKSGMGKTKKL